MSGMMRDSGQDREEAVSLEVETQRESAVNLSRLRRISHANFMYNVQDGEITELIDTAAGTAASRDAGDLIVTLSITPNLRGHESDPGRRDVPAAPGRPVVSRRGPRDSAGAL